MPANVDGTKAAYARKPAWHGIGTVKEEGMMSAAECLAVLNPSGESIRKGKVTVTIFVPDGKGGMKEVVVDAPEYAGLVDFDSDTQQFRTLAVNGQNYPDFQREEQFKFADEVIGHVDGSHYEAAVNLKNGKQTVLTAYLGDYVLDPNGIADQNKRFLWIFNSWDTSWALRLKMGDFRVECANMAAVALRGSSDTNQIGSDWSTRHTSNISQRVEEAAAFLGLWRAHENLFEAQAEHMIHCELDDNAFGRIIDGLFTAENPKTQQMETDKEAVETVRMTYELSASSRDIHSTIWGGFNAVTEYNDWVQKVRPTKSASMNERRLLRQVEDPSGLKQNAWDRFWDLAADTKPFKMPDLAS
jgi:phage/plasmid-like protein (TIGR03299 family)